MLGIELYPKAESEERLELQLLRGNSKAEVWFLIRNVFSEEEFEQLLFGEEALDMQAWKTGTVYEGFTAESQVVIWFWQVVCSFAAEEQRQLLEFCYGSSALPPDGFSSLAFTLRNAGGPKGSVA